MRPPCGILPAPSPPGRLHLPAGRSKRPRPPRGRAADRHRPPSATGQTAAAERPRRHVQKPAWPLVRPCAAALCRQAPGPRRDRGKAGQPASGPSSGPGAWPGVRWRGRPPPRRSGGAARSRRRLQVLRVASAVLLPRESLPRATAGLPARAPRSHAATMSAHAPAAKARLSGTVAAAASSLARAPAATAAHRWSNHRPQTAFAARVAAASAASAPAPATGTAAVNRWWSHRPRATFGARVAASTAVAPVAAAASAASACRRSRTARRRPLP
mmetsp:Transcript_93172/g.268144  ORF Transcript_93172/g.268144 Transcript_93172/m.268144 type:complete len:272 (+) Transcript_93172:623-1438(+)